MVGLRQLVSRNLDLNDLEKNCMKTESSHNLLNQRVKLNEVKLTGFQKQVKEHGIRSNYGVPIMT